MVRLILLTLLVFAAAAFAAPTAAWKVPLETLAPDYKTNEKIRKLEKPPGESAFFKDGDELWDVSGILRDESLIPYGWIEGSYEDEEKPAGPWKGEWAVWNARSGRLVARGSFRDLMKAQLAWDFEEPPTKIQVRFEWLRPGVAMPFHSIAAICRSGDTFEKADDDFSIEANPCMESGRRISIRLAATWKPRGGGSRWDVVTALPLSQGKRVMVAKHGSGETGWELHLTCQEIGIEDAEPRLVETKRHGLQAWRRGFAEIPGPSRIPLGDGSSLVWYDAGPPFGSAPMPLPDEDLKQIPEPLGKWVDGPLTNCSDTLRKEVSNIDEPAFFAGIDQLAGQLIVAASDQTQAAVSKLMEQIGPQMEMPLWIESNAGSGNHGLAVRSGEKGVISTLEGEDAETIFDVEATRGDSGIGVRLKMQIVTEGEERGSVETHVEMIPDRWQKVMEAKSESSTEVLLRAAISRP